MNRFTVMTALAAAAVSAVGLGVCVPAAQAAPALPAMGNAASPSWAGYLVSKGPKRPMATAKFTVPKLICSSDNQSGIFIGADMIVQDGASAVVSGVNAMCVNGAPSYSSFVAKGIVYPVDFTVDAGDRISVLVRAGFDNDMTFTDLTRDESVKYQPNGEETGTISELVGVLPLGSDGSPLSSSGRLPIPQFRPLGFSHAQESGTTPEAAGATAVNLESTGSSPVIQIETGPLNSAGIGWSETFEHS